MPVSWTSRDNEGRPKSNCCMVCKCVLAKITRSGIFSAKFKANQPLMQACRMHNGDQAVREEFVEAHAKYIAGRRQGRGKNFQQLLKPKEEVSVEASAPSAQ